MDLDYSFHAMGSDVRLLIGRPLMAGMPTPLDAADRERSFVLDYAQRLSRFRPDSELSALNCDPRRAVPVSPLLRAAVAAGLWAAWRSDGLLDPTLVTALERAGYRSSLDGAAPASLSDALATAPARRPARPDSAGRWREVIVDEEAGLVVRPPGIRLDTGGTGKGLCADAVAHRLSRYTRVLVDCGGDISVVGVGAQLDPFEVEVEHPFTGVSIGRIALRQGGVATSGLNVRIWRDATGRYAHHLIDPSSGRPAWTGVVAATAVGPSALEAETLSKIALLLGPTGALDVLAAHGGVIVHDSGEAEVIGPLELRGAAKSPTPALTT